MSDVVAARIRELRHGRGWKPADLAGACAKIGGDLTENAIENIESGRRQGGRRRRAVTVDELFTIGQALGVNPVSLLPGQGPKGSLGPLSMDEIRNTIGSLQAFVSLQEQEGGS